MFALQGVGRRFPNGVVALTDVNLGVQDADFVVLLGPSGCGKSTLLRIVAGLDAPSEGRVAWDGGAAPLPGETGFVFQDPTLLPWASAARNAALPLRLRGVAEADAVARAALARVGLAEAADRLPSQLSGGMRMRVSIARALASRPRLLLMDEPFAALDEFTRHRLQEDLRALWAELGCTVVFVTHSLYEAAFLARRVVVMTPHPGRVAREFSAPWPADGLPDRLSPEYAALVAELTRAVAVP